MRQYALDSVAINLLEAREVVVSSLDEPFLLYLIDMAMLETGKKIAAEIPVSSAKMDTRSRKPRHVRRRLVSLLG
jgi:hypothetical protein